MKNLKIGKKLLITFMMIIVLFCCTVFVAVWGLKRNEEKYTQFYNVGYQITNKVMSMRRGLQIIVKDIAFITIEEDEAKSETYKVDLQKEMTLLEDNGLINNALAAVGLPRVHMINTAGAVVLGMVYNYIPYMILPLYSVLTKIDRSVIEAAQDLGANSVQVFLKVVVPLSMPGVISGVTMVFVPAVSTFIISKMLGGGGNLLIGDLIDMQFLGSAYNPNLGSAVSLVLMVIILICMGIMNQFDDGEEAGGGMLL